MRIHLFSSTIAILLCTITTMVANEEPAKRQVFHMKKKASGQTIELTIVEVPFKKQGRKIEKRDGSYVMKIDGRGVLGTDGMLPYAELSSFTLKWNGKNIPVPEKLWKDCYNLGVGVYKEEKYPEPGHDPQVKVTEDGEYMTIRFSGSDGAGYYDIIWILAKNGKHARWVQ